MIKAKVKFIESFKDGNIIPRLFRVGEVAVLDESVVERIRQSGGVLEVVERLVPNPKKVEKDAS